MKKSSLFLIGFLFLISCGGEETSSEASGNSENTGLIAGDVYMSGLIDDKYEIFLKLHLPEDEEGSVDGEYFYQSQKKPIRLSGNRKGNHLELDEFVGEMKTGQFIGDLVQDNGVGFVGVWKDVKKTELSVEMVQSSADTYSEYIMTIDYGDGSDEALTFEELLAKFELTALPATIDLRENVDMFDTNTVKKYFAEDSWEDWNFGWNEWKPIFRFENGDYHALVIEHFYTPGAFGINNTFLEVHTFTRSGKKVDDAQVGCYCNDTNMGANDYYSTNDHVTFTKDGWIKIASEHIHATLFDEEMEDGQEPFDTRDSSYNEIQILKNGTIQNFAD